MAFSSQVAKKRFENLSIKELEERYNALKKNYCFDTKEEQISHIINNYYKKDPIHEYKRDTYQQITAFHSYVIII